jgi:hypothetical protein
MKISIVYFWALVLIISSCQDTNSNIEEKSVKVNSDSISTKNVIHNKGLMEEVRLSDSAVVMFYKTPGNPRFFSYCKIKNISELFSIVDDINKPLSDSMKGCSTNGKIYFYGKADVVYPVYFTSDNACSGFSFIKTGEKYFTKMSIGSKAILDSLKHKAKDL